jgi:hypothetical protein
MSRHHELLEFIDRQYVIEEGTARERSRRFSRPISPMRRRRDADPGRPGAGRRHDPHQPSRWTADRDLRLEEHGDTVRWHVSATFPGLPEDGGDLDQESDLTAVFGPDGQVHTMWVEDAPS